VNARFLSVRGGHRRRCGSNDYTSRGSSRTKRPCVSVPHTRQRARARARSRVYGRRAADGGDLFLFLIYVSDILFLL